MSFLQRLSPPVCDWVLYKSSALPAVDLRDLNVQSAGPKQTLDKAQRRQLRRHIPALKLWRFLASHRRGEGWVFFASSGDQICHHAFVTPARLYQRMFPVMESGALMLGPCLTEEPFRGRAIYPRMLAHMVNTLHEQGHGPFYVYTNCGNAASIRGMEKAGFERCGVWQGKRYLMDLRVVSRQIAD